MRPKVMTDKWKRSDIISALALVVASISGFFTFNSIDPTLQEIKHWPRMKFVERIVPFGNGRLYIIDVWNDGDMPATGVMAVIDVLKSVELPDLSKTQIEPPEPHKLEVNGRRLSVTLHGGLKHHDHFYIRLPVLRFAADKADENPQVAALTESFVIKTYVFSDQGHAEEHPWIIDEDLKGGAGH
jgi:hypothetical protein